MAEATPEQRREHGYCNDLRRSGAFSWYLGVLALKAATAQREVTAEHSPSRDYYAGRLSGLLEAAQIVEQRYKSLAPIVEVIPE